MVDEEILHAVSGVSVWNPALTSDVSCSRFAETSAAGTHHHTATFPQAVLLGGFALNLLETLLGGLQFLLCHLKFSV